MRKSDKTLFLMDFVKLCKDNILQYDKKRKHIVTSGAISGVMMYELYCRAKKLLEESTTKEI